MNFCTHQTKNPCREPFARELPCSAQCKRNTTMGASILRLAHQASVPAAEVGSRSTWALLSKSCFPRLYRHQDHNANLQEPIRWHRSRKVCPKCRRPNRLRSGFLSRVILSQEWTREVDFFKTNGSRIRLRAAIHFQLSEGCLVSLSKTYGEY